MSTLQLQLDRRLAQTVAITGRLKRDPARPRIAAALFAAVDWFARATFYAWRNRRYLTTIKLMNMAAVNLQYLLKTERVWGRPYNLKIESTNICNTHCQLCPTGLGYAGRAKGKMDPAKFRGLVDRYRWFLFGLDLSMWGDPLIVPEIFDMIRYAHDKGIWTYVSSNLHAFKPHKGQAEALVKSGLDMLTCSLHGASAETFSTYQPGKEFEETVAKVRHIVQTRDALGSSTPVIQLNFVVTRFNEHERDAFTRLAAELGCRAVFSTASLNTRFLGKERGRPALRTAQGASATTVSLGLAPDLQARRSREQTLEHIRKWLPRDEAFALAPYREMLAGREFKPEEFNGKKLMDCAWPWRSTVVNWDGNVSTCCGSWEASEDMGNVFETSLSAIWNGPRYRMARRSFKRKVDDAAAKDNPCASCPGFML